LSYINLHSRRDQWEKQNILLRPNGSSRRSLSAAGLYSSLRMQFALAGVVAGYLNFVTVSSIYYVDCTFCTLQYLITATGDCNRYTAFVNYCMFSPNQITACIFSPSQLTVCMFSPNQLTACMFSPSQLTACMFSPNQLTACMFSPIQLTVCMLSPNQLTVCMLSPNQLTVCMFSPIN